MNPQAQTRRRLLTIAGTAIVAGLAGCSGQAESDTEPTPETDDPTPTEMPADKPEETDVDPAAWEDVDEIAFEGRMEAWTGIEPQPIAGEDNPTLVLFEGKEYILRWENADGAIHNLEIWDDDGDLVEDYETEATDVEGDELSIEGVIGSPDMARYVCYYHQGTQAGDIEVRE